MSVDLSPRVGLATLRSLGVDEKLVSKLRDEIHKSNQLALDGFDRVGLRTLEKHARSLGLAGKVEELAALIKPRAAGPVLNVPASPDAFPKPALSIEAPRSHAARSAADAKVVATDLGSASSAVAAFLNALVSGKTLPAMPDLAKGGVPATQLAELLEKDRNTARAHMTGDQIETALTAVYSKFGPAYTDRDAKLDLSSTYTKLALPSDQKPPPGVELFKKSSFEHLFLRRDAQDGFSLHGFRTEKVVVTLPPGHSLLLIGSDGDQHAVHSAAAAQTINGAKVNAFEIGRELVQPSSARSFVQNPSFTIKVLDASKKPVFEQTIAFGNNPGTRSEQLFDGSFAANKKPPEGGDRHFERFVPDARSNAVPAGERPLLSLEGGVEADRLVIQRDQKRMSFDRLSQLLHPPGAKPQTLKAKDANGQIQIVTIKPANSSQTHLDHPEYNPSAGAIIQNSNGHKATFDRSLGAADQARWTFRGLVIESSGGREVAFNPLAG